MGMAPIIDGMGLIITVLSYNGHITISPTSDARSMPDIDAFAKLIRESANTLEEKVLDYKRVKEKSKKRKVPAKSTAFINHVKKYLKDHPDFLRPNAGLHQIEVKGPNPTSWSINLNTPPGTIKKGQSKDPDVILTIADEHLYKIGRGQLDFQTAFVQGRLKIKGDMKIAMKLAKILSLIPALSK